MSVNNINAELNTPLSSRRGVGGEASSSSQRGVGGEASQYIDLFQHQRHLICAHAPRVMNAVRDAAFERFRSQGFPSRKVERYKYTDMAKLFAPDYGLNLSRLPIPVDPYEAFRCDVPNLSTLLYFMVNDQFYGGQTGGKMAATDGHREERGEHLSAPKLPAGVVIGPLAEHEELAQPYYNRMAAKDEAAVSDLNTMLAQDALLVYVPRGVKIERTVQVINILKAPPLWGRAEEEGLMVNRRVLIILEEGAEAKLLFCDHAADDCHFLTTQVIEAYVGPRAALDLYCLEETHHKNVRVSNVYIDQQQDSRVNHNVITLHNGITRNKLDLTLSGEGAQCGCYGCVIADKQQHVDNNTLIVHRVPHCTSNQLYKYVLDEQATGAFAGRVLVEQGAQQTVSQMTNQNLCATREARMYTQPMLEIYADDVKCAHGCTVGQLNDAALFYMRQRGIPLREARLLLETAFINEVIDKMELQPLRDRLHHLVDKRFRGELSKCNGCKLCR